MSERIKYGEMACGHLAGDTRCQCLRLKEMVKALEAENAKLRAVVEAAKELVQEHYIDATCKNCTGETNHVEQLLENLERLETTNG